MRISVFQMVVVINKTIPKNYKKHFLEQIEGLIKKYARITSISYKKSQIFNNNINNYENNRIIVIEFKIASSGSLKRIHMIEEKLNTIDEIEDYKIIQKGITNLQSEDTFLYLVYEFDFGDVVENLKPTITFFKGFYDKKKANEYAKELLDEGLDKYFIDEDLKNIDNPFICCNEVHLYKNEKKEEQIESVYYIKIEKLKIE